jgi:16S rRNA (guanine1207-N2)-methyltransferase
MSSKYYEWQILRTHDLEYFSKPGVAYYGEEDPSAELFLENLPDAEILACLNCGDARAGIVFAQQNPEAKVLLSDVSFLAIESNKKTIQHLGLENVETAFSFTIDKKYKGKVDAVLIRLPKAKLFALQLISEAFQNLKEGGACYLAGGNNEGVQSVLKYIKEYFGNMEVISYQDGHRIGKAVKESSEPNPSERFTEEAVNPDFFHTYEMGEEEGDLTIFTRPGIFSYEHLDSGRKNSRS